MSHSPSRMEIVFTGRECRVSPAPLTTTGSLAFMVLWGHVRMFRERFRGAARALHVSRRSPDRQSTMLPRIGFGVKATAGMLLFALAPCYCVYALADASSKGTIRKPNRDRIERAGRIENPFAPPQPR